MINFFIILIYSGLAFSQFNGPFRQDYDFTNDRDKTLIYLPKDYDKNKRYPLLISLHGLGASAPLQNLVFDFRELTTKFGFILAVPNGLKGAGGLRFWNATDFCCGNNQRPVDDVQFIKDLIEGMSEEYSVDSDRVHLFGHSNGGFLSYRIACETQSLIASIASFAGVTFLDDSKCLGAEPMPILHIHGTGDLIISYNGTSFYPSARKTVQQWINLNKCGRENFVKEENTILKPKNMNLPFLRTIEETWSSCQGNTKIAFWTIDKGEHLTEPNKEYLERILKYLLQFRKR